MCSPRDDFNPVFSTRIKIHPGTKTSGKHDSFSRPGARQPLPEPHYICLVANDHSAHIPFTARGSHFGPSSRTMSSAKER